MTFSNSTVEAIQNVTFQNIKKNRTTQKYFFKTAICSNYGTPAPEAKN
jgi:hypothetical protein